VPLRRNIIVPFAAGGSGDVLARVVAQHLTILLRQQFIVENRPGIDAEGRLTDQASIDLIRQLVGELRGLTIRLRDTQIR
jgi:hypothetical protein